jgi:hypothetical protein
MYNRQRASGSQLKKALEALYYCRERKAEPTANWSAMNNLAECALYAKGRLFHFVRFLDILDQLLRFKVIILYSLTQIYKFVFLANMFYFQNIMSRHFGIQLNHLDINF